MGEAAEERQATVQPPMRQRGGGPMGNWSFPTARAHQWDRNIEA
jgi:hypothetical protein